jgi:hypothetical protein
MAKRTVSARTILHWPLARSCLIPQHTTASLASVPEHISNRLIHALSSIVCSVNYRLFCSAKHYTPSAQVYWVSASYHFAANGLRIAGARLRP